VRCFIRRLGLPGSLSALSHGHKMSTVRAAKNLVSGFHPEWGTLAIVPSADSELCSPQSVNLNRCENRHQRIRQNYLRQWNISLPIEKNWQGAGKF
jgi:hypothetical protein